MVTKIRSAARAHLYISEWMEHRGLSDDQIGNRLGVGRTSVWRWRTQQHRLNPEKIAALAEALDVEPQELWRPPARRSVDALLRDAPDELHETAVDIVERLLKRA